MHNKTKEARSTRVKLIGQGSQVCTLTHNKLSTLPMNLTNYECTLKKLPLI